MVQGVLRRSGHPPGVRVAKSRVIGSARVISHVRGIRGNNIEHDSSSFNKVQGEASLGSKRPEERLITKSSPSNSQTRLNSAMKRRYRKQQQEKERAQSLSTAAETILTGKENVPR